MKKWLLSMSSVLGLGFSLASAQAQDPNKICKSEEAEGFKMIFDGTEASFRGYFVDWVSGSATNTNLDAEWKLDAANMAIKSSGSDPDTRTKTKVNTRAGFDIRWSYRNPSNQGVIYLMNTSGCCSWASGVEFGIDDNDNSKTGAGSAYDIFAPSPFTYKKFSTAIWNDTRIVVKGDSVEHWMNGRKVVGYRYHNQRFWDAYNLSKWNSGNELTNLVKGQRGALGAGYITDGFWGLQADHNGAWQIRSLRISVDSAKVAVGIPKGLSDKVWTAANTAGTWPPAAGTLDDWPGRCNTTAIGPQDPYKYTLKRMHPSLRRAAGELSVDYGLLPLREVELVGLDGRSRIKATLTEGGTRAVFRGAIKRGVYALRARDAKFQVVHKVNIL